MTTPINKPSVLSLTLKLKEKGVTLSDRTKSQMICSLPEELLLKLNKRAEAKYQRVDTLVDYIVNTFILDVDDMIIFSEGKSKYKFSGNVIKLFKPKENIVYNTFEVTRQTFGRIHHYKNRYPLCNRSFILRRMVEKYFGNNP